ncbi:DUF4249 domain-containing protein [Bacteroides sp. UBA939]|uniref:DUF4249 domain-containing protein n=1 Tax=Bacteroides sp. UBA939 TaxID=1946092 RepID=UPI0025BB9C75|nr:DUF4249 domain-containing protein [Bacteroides sp. UBA939]
MKKRTSILILVSLLLLALTNCIDEFNAKLPGDSVGMLVVDGNIISDSTVVFSLSRTFSLNEERLPGGFNQIIADVSVVGDDGSRIIGTSIGNGKYQVQIGTLNKQVRYGLEVKYEGDTYTSEAQYPIETPAIDEVKFEQPEDYGDISIYLSTQKTDGTVYYIWEYEEDWEVRALYYSLWEYDFLTKKILEYETAPYAQGWSHAESNKTIVGSTEANTENLIKNKKMYSIASDNIRISYYYSTLIRQRALTKGEFEYYENKAKQSEGMGGLFTPQPSELPSNITCSNPNKKAIGYVGVNMNISEYRLYISVNDIDYDKPYVCIGAPPEDVMSMTNEELYLAGYRVSHRDSKDEYHWDIIKCVDVRSLGATFNKPSFWPLPDWKY